MEMDNFEGEGRPIAIGTLCAELCKNGQTDRDAVWVEDSGDPTEPCITWGSDRPIDGDNFKGKGAAHCKVQRFSAVSCAIRAQQLLRWATV